MSGCCAGLRKAPDVSRFAEGKQYGTNASPSHAASAGGQRSGAGFCSLMLGLSCGILCPSHLASIGYFQHKFHSDLLFGLQVAVVVAVHSIAELILDVLNQRTEKPNPHGDLVRLGIGTTLASVALVMTPACSSQLAVLINGAAISLLKTWLFRICLRLAALSRGSLFAKLGYAAGSLVVAVLMVLLQLGPGSSPLEAVAFYALTAAVVLGGGLLWACWSVFFGVFGADDGLPLHSALSTISPVDPAEAPQAGAQPFMRPSWFVVENSAGIFVSVAASFAILPAFTLANPWIACWLYVMKCLGDFVGRLAALGHSMTAGGINGWQRSGAYCLLGGRLILVSLVAAWLLRGGHEDLRWPHASICMTALTVYGSGCYLQLMLGMDSHLKATSMEDAQRSERFSWIAESSGYFVGLAGGVLLLLLHA
mmetsp:Transcript_79285/g.157008  ORF Transcript_79285/g.157008 Transcript_79285/m.157008 type:complete len:424 (+) Transcript_79285:103-1374(+)